MKTNIIYNQDCLELLKKIPNESIDLVVTDPPYKIIAGGVRVIEEGEETKGVLNRRGSSIKNPKSVLDRGRIVVSDGTNCSNKWIKKTRQEDTYKGDGTDANEARYNNLNTPSAVKNGMMFEHNEIKFSEWLPEVYRVLKKCTHCYIMVNSRNLNELQNESDKVGFVFQNLLVWHKTNSQTPNKYYMQNAEFILMLSKRPAKNINNMGTKTVLSIPNIIGNKMHPTEKPVDLIKILIENSSQKNEIVLDIFMGVGSTARASKILERRYIGSEIDEAYYTKSLELLDESQRFRMKKSERACLLEFK